MIIIITLNYGVIGYYCPEGSFQQTPCEPGTYTDQTGQTECLTCPTGYYCPQATSDYTTFPCPVGRYCPPGTPSANSYLCPLPTFNNVTMITTVDDCIPCLPGWYCDETGLAEPLTVCPEGFYCPANTSEPITCPRGSYCPEGVGAYLTCPAGEYCDRNGLVSSTGQ